MYIIIIMNDIYVHSPAISSVPSILGPWREMKENIHFSNQIIY
jgi:hypothetical protein